MNDTECNYERVQQALSANGFSEQQVQAVFIKSADGFPECDLKHLYCSPSALPDAYYAEQRIGDILRYLRCCELPSNGNPQTSRYPNLQQVFIISRSYGGYGNLNYVNNHITSSCLNPEPFAYELGFSVQRSIVAQINQDASLPNSDAYSGDLHYNPNPNGTPGNGAPWFDWGPYIWADGTNQSPGNQLLWCDSTTTGVTGCQFDPGDFRFGDTGNPTVYWGDHIHPTSNGLQKVASQLVEWFQNTLPSGQGHISDWIHTWVTTQ